MRANVEWLCDEIREYGGGAGMWVTRRGKGRAARVVSYTAVKYFLKSQF